MKMSSSSSQNDSLMNEIQPDLIPYDSDEHEGCWTSDQDISSPSDMPSSPSTIHKASQNRFFVWVATTRPNLNSRLRYTCPMIGCETPFRSLDLMLYHLRICTYFAKGYYRCVESGRKEKVGKCGTAGCQELKGRLVTAVNSGLKTVKRHFSGRSGQSSKILEATEATFTKTPIPHYPLEMSALSDRPVGVAELSGSAIPIEMEGTCNYNSPSDTLSELGGKPMAHEGTRNFSLSLMMEGKTSHDSRNHQYLPDEYHTSEDLSSAPAYTFQSHEASSGMNTHQDFTNISSNVYHAQTDISDYTTEDQSWIDKLVAAQPSHISAPSPSYDQGHINNVQSNIAGVDNHAHQHDISQGCHFHGQPSQIETRNYREQGHVDEYSYPAYQIPNHASHAIRYQSRTYSGTSSDTSESISVFSNARRLTQDSSTSSVDLISNPLNDGQSFPVSFSGDESSVFFEEADSMDCDFESTVPSPLLTGENYRQSFNPTAHQADANRVSYDVYNQTRGFSSSQAPQYWLSSQVLSPRHGVDVDTGTVSMTPPQSLLSSAAIRIAHPQPRRRHTTRKINCKHCHVPKDSSNIPRHEKCCKMNPDRPKGKLFKCPGCDSKFTRVDNGSVHQRRLGHLGNLELHVRFTPSSIPPEMHMVLDERDRYMRAERAEMFNR